MFGGIWEVVLGGLGKCRGDFWRENADNSNNSSSNNDKQNNKVYKTLHLFMFSKFLIFRKGVYIACGRQQK